MEAQQNAAAIAAAAAEVSRTRAVAGYTERGCITVTAMYTCLLLIAALILVAVLVTVAKGEPVAPVVFGGAMIGAFLALVVSMMYAGTEF